MMDLDKLKQVIQQSNYYAYLEGIDYCSNGFLEDIDKEVRQFIKNFN